MAVCCVCVCLSPLDWTERRLIELLGRHLAARHTNVAAAALIVDLAPGNDGMSHQHQTPTPTRSDLRLFIYLDEIKIQVRTPPPVRVCVCARAYLLGIQHPDRIMCAVVNPHFGTQQTAHIASVTVGNASTTKNNPWVMLCECRTGQRTTTHRIVELLHTTNDKLYAQRLRSETFFICLFAVSATRNILFYCRTVISRSEFLRCKKLFHAVLSLSLYLRIACSTHTKNNCIR